MKTFFLGRRWVNNQRKWNSLWSITLHRKIIELICCARRLLDVSKSRLNIRICQHCGVKTNTVTPSFYYVFNISLSCKNSIRSFIANLWRVLLLGSRASWKHRHEAFFQGLTLNFSRMLGIFIAGSPIEMNYSEKFQIVFKKLMCCEYIFSK